MAKRKPQPHQGIVINGGIPSKQQTPSKFDEHKRSVKVRLDDIAFQRELGVRKNDHLR